MKHIVILFLFLAGLVNAGSRIDSLRSVLIVSTPEEKIDVYLKLSDEYKMTSAEQSILCIEQAYRQAIEIKMHFLAAKILSQLARRQQDFQHYDSAISSSLRAATLYDSLGEKRRSATNFANVGTIYSQSNQFLLAQEYYEKALLICGNDSSMQFLKAICYESVGSIFYIIGKFDEALPFHHKAMLLFIKENSTINVAKMNYLLGADYSAMCQYEKSIDFYFKSLKIYEQVQNVEGIATIYHAIGLVYEDMGYLDKSLDLNLRALDYANSVYNFEYKSSLYEWIGSIYSDKKQYDESISYLNKAYKIEQGNNDKLGIVTTLEKIGQVKLQNDKPIEALSLYKECLQILSGTDEEWRKSKIFISIGAVYSELGNYENSIWYIESGIKMAKKNKIKDFVLDGYEVLTSVYKKKGDFAKAFFYLQEYEDLKDSLYIENSSRVAEFQLKYETDKRESENNFLRQQNDLQRIKIKKQQTRLWQLSISMMFFSVIFIFGYYRYYSKNRNNRSLYNKLGKAAVKQKEQEQFLIHKAALATLGELAAGIIHDLKQPLQDIRLSAEEIQMEIGEDRTNHDSIQAALNDIYFDVERMTTMTDYVILYASRKAYEKHELFNINKSVSNAYRLIRKQLMRQNLNLVLDLQNEIPDVNGNSWKFEQVLLNLFSNSAHAILEVKKYKPNNFKERFIIKTFSNDTHIVVTVDDNGIGVVQKFKNIMFYPFATSKKPGEGSGLGLSIVYNVVREMSGRLDFKSTPFVGTTIVLIFPYQGQNKGRL